MGSCLCDRNAAEVQWNIDSTDFTRQFVHDNIPRLAPAILPPNSQRQRTYERELHTADFLLHYHVFGFCLGSKHAIHNGLGQYWLLRTYDAFQLCHSCCSPRKTRNPVAQTEKNEGKVEEGICRTVDCSKVE